MLTDDYVLITSLEYEAAKVILSVLHSETAPPSEQILLLWESPEGEHHYLYISEAHFFLFCLVVDCEITQGYNQCKVQFDEVAETTWPRIQAENGMVEDGQETMQLRYCETPHHAGVPSYFTLTAGGVTVHLSSASVMVLPQVAGFIRQDWRNLSALTR